MGGARAPQANGLVIPPVQNEPVRFIWLCFAHESADEGRVESG